MSPVTYSPPRQRQEAVTTPYILLPSPLHLPISTHVSVVMGNSDKRTLLGKKKIIRKSSAQALKVKPHHFILLFPPLCIHKPPHLIHGQIMSVYISNDSFQIAFLYVPHSPRVNKNVMLADV